MPAMENKLKKQFPSTSHNAFWIRWNAIAIIDPILIPVTQTNDFLLCPSWKTRWKNNFSPQIIMLSVDKLHDYNKFNDSRRQCDLQRSTRCSRASLMMIRYSFDLRWSIVCALSKPQEKICMKSSISSLQIGHLTPASMVCSTNSSLHSSHIARWRHGRHTWFLTASMQITHCEAMGFSGTSWKAWYDT